MNWGIAMADADKAMQELDDLFAAARGNPAPMSVHLTRAILDDAVAAQSAITAPMSVPKPRIQVGLWRQLMGVIGGLPAVGGLVTACAIGVWVGLAPPSFLPDPMQLVGYTDSTSVPYDSYDLAMVLGEEMQ